ISQGMLVELGYSIAKDKKLILAIQTGIKESIFRRQIGTVIEFDNIEELKNKLENMLLKE
ncbi:MAG: hypothetical protein NTY48_07280, partial [Candidatus Diapherotrites archaeon]|nr:hypothetical protein [Candidatus Diapherotrites archaeon]